MMRRGRSVPGAPSDQHIELSEQAVATTDARDEILDYARKRSRSDNEGGAAAERRQPARGRGGQDHEEYQEPCHPGGSHSATDNEYSCRVEKEETACRKALVPNLLYAEAAVASWLPELNLLKQQMSDSLHRLVDGFVQQPLKTCVNCLAHVPAEVSGYRSVLYHSVTQSFDVKIPQLRCSSCSKPYEMPAVVVRCVDVIYLSLEGMTPSRPADMSISSHVFLDTACRLFRVVRGPVSQAYLYSPSYPELRV